MGNEVSLCDDALTPNMLQQFRNSRMKTEDINKLNAIEQRNVDDAIKQYHLDDEKTNYFPKKELRLVLLGKTGAGKSATGNMILGENSFLESSSSTSCTRVIQSEEVNVNGVRIRVIDTPGLCDTSISESDITTEIAKVIEVFPEGIDGFLFVYNMGNPRFTKDQSEVFRRIGKGLFGPTFLDHCYVIFTHAEMLKGSTLEQYLQNDTSEFGHLMKYTLKRKVVGVENNIRTVYGRKRQHEKLIRTLQSSLIGVYTNDIFTEICMQREEAAKHFAAYIRAIIPNINDTLIKKFEGKRVGEIQQMAPVDDDHLCTYVFEKVKPLVKHSPTTDIIQEENEDKQLQQAIDSQFRLMKKRLTSPLAKVVDFVKNLMTAAGVFFKSIVAAGARFFREVTSRYESV